MRHDIEARLLLEDERARDAFASLLGLLNTDDGERSSIFSATADIVQVNHQRARGRRGARPDPRGLQGSSAAPR